MTEKGVADTALLKMAAGASAGNKENEPSQSGVQTHVTRAHQQAGFRLSIKLGITSLVLGLGVTLVTAAEQGGPDHTVSDLELQTRLTTSQIIDTFSNVIDRGEVQDQRGISAETHWYADGRFVSQWWQRSEGDADPVPQSVAGHWRAENDLRCVAFAPVTENAWSCAEVWRLEDGRYLSMNPDGSIHGLHVLTNFEPR